MSWISASYCDGCYDSYCDGCYDSHYDSYCNSRYSGQAGCCDGSYDSTTKAKPPEGLKGQRAQEEEAEGY
jgi:hypothetical protein